jgi:hypothetical protein
MLSLSSRINSIEFYLQFIEDLKQPIEDEPRYINKQIITDPCSFHDRLEDIRLTSENLAKHELADYLEDHILDSIKLCDYNYYVGCKNTNMVDLLLQIAMPLWSRFTEDSLSEPQDKNIYAFGASLGKGLVAVICILNRAWMNDNQSNINKMTEEECAMIAESLDSEW